MLIFIILPGDLLVNFVSPMHTNKTLSHLSWLPEDRSYMALLYGFFFQPVQGKMKDLLYYLLVLILASTGRWWKRQENPWILVSQLAWHLQWSRRDPVSNKAKGEDSGHLRLSSDLHMYTMTCVSFIHEHAHIHHMHVHTHTHMIWPWVPWEEMVGRSSVK